MRFNLCFLFLLSTHVMAQANPPLMSPQPGQVLVSGTVADEASKAAVLSKLRELYGIDKVVDQIVVSQVAVPANWNGYVQKLINPNLKLISKGQLKIDGNSISVKGEVANEAQRQQIVSDIATNLNPTYIVSNGLRVSASEQQILDATLGNRTVEFEIGKANLTPGGKQILDEMAQALQKLGNKKIEIIGHTDNQGLRASNIALSQARADTVKMYLIAKSINPDLMSTLGQGSDRPIATNDTVDGRSRNRRIEFRVGQ